MIKVYLDWNVMSQMKNGHHNELKEILLNNPNFLLPFSTSHISDIFSSYKNTPEQISIINDDLDFISNLTNELCFYNNGKRIIIDYYSPKELFQQNVDEKDQFNDLSIDGLKNLIGEDELTKNLVGPLFDLLKTIPIEQSLKSAFKNPESAEMMEEIFPGLKNNPTMGGFFSSFSKMIFNLNELDGYKKLRKTIQTGTGINRDKIFDTEDPFKLIEENYKKLGEALSPNNLVNNKNKYAPEWFNKISNEYIQLDMHGYQEDKVNIKKGRKETFKNTTDDAFHSAFASACNFYIVNDKKSYKKTKKIYEKLNINTYVVKPNEFLDYYIKFLKKDNYSTELYIFQQILVSDNFFETKTENGVFKTYLFPYFIFDFFNRLVVFINKDNEQVTFLSQNKPTNYFVINLEIERLVNRLISFFGTDIDKKGHLKTDELKDENWSGRKWKIGDLNLQLVLANKHAQLYFDIEKPAGNTV